MAFTLRVWFSGLCQFITNSAVGSQGSQVELCVVLPNASAGSAPHIANVSRPDREAIPPNRFRLEYNPKQVIQDFTSPSRVEFRFTPNPIAGGAGVFFSFGPDRLIDLKALAGSYADNNPEIVSNWPVGGLIAQVVFERGIAGIDENAAVRSSWSLPDTLLFGSAGFVPVEVAEPRFVEIHDLESATLVVTNLGSGDVEEHDLTPAEEEFAEILISNRCVDREPCFEIRPVGGNLLQVVQIDEDFAFHYSLLHPITIQSLSQHFRITRRPDGGIEYPVPERVVLQLWADQEFFGEVEKVFEPIRFYLGIEGDEVRLSKARGGTKEKASSVGFSDFNSWLDILPDPTREVVRKIVKRIQKAVGSGAGCDCLPCRGESRFLDLPTVSATALSGDTRDAATLKATVGAPFPRIAEIDSATGSRTVRAALPTSAPSAVNPPAETPVAVKLASNGASADRANSVDSGATRVPVPRAALRRPRS